MFQHRITQGNDCVFSPSVLLSFGLPLPPTCLLLTVSEARSYFAYTILNVKAGGTYYYHGLEKVKNSCVRGRQGPFKGCRATEEKEEEDHEYTVRQQ
jgi:hypothetical protein